ncbi:SGNH/GDSL hydrolase family protein [Lutimonas zeaxanthinifaciens]|uniref:SGNH/GDSL hydrolase family protein n=1 Tax=Lutimonas zeaxanthinifaciens TaxID=3060215 RepID=UPI00265D548A|nr:SGNH/GDSL hydrolase family protein [Lutimonas sp. YSD2104]WKK66256.1 SGNH/GDSL hydrolase family protein [Lutimonas sp. YSD2104]
MNKIKILLFVILFLSLHFSISGQGKAIETDGKTYSVLFIGNSLTYTNNLPRLLEKKASQNNIKIKTQMIAYPNYALVDHLSQGDIQSEIIKNKYDFVVVQQGPSSQQEGKKLLLEATEKIAQLCKENGSKLCVFMVWPSLSYYQTFDGVIENYRSASKLNNAILCPVGETWKKHIDENRSYEYYGPDGFHPSKKGSQQAAGIIFYSLFPNS